MSTGYSSTLDRTAISSSRGVTYVLSGGSSHTMSQSVTLPSEDSERDYVARLWSEDWDSAEDAAYDTL
jgi:TolB-like protein